MPYLKPCSDQDGISHGRSRGDVPYTLLEPHNGGPMLTTLAIKKFEPSKTLNFVSFDIFNEFVANFYFLVMYLRIS